MRLVAGVGKVVAAIALWISSLLTIMFILFFNFRNVLGGFFPIICIVGSIGITVFEMKCMYKKGIGIVVLILALIQTIFIAASEYLADLEGTEGLLKALTADNFSHIKLAFPLMALVVLFYIAGYFIRIKLQKDWERACEEAARLQQEREQQMRQQREDAYYEEYQAQQRAYERFQRDYQQQQAANNSTEDSDYEKAKSLFMLSSDEYTLEEIKKTRNRLLKSFHPDETAENSDDNARMINNAFEILKSRLQK